MLKMIDSRICFDNDEALAAGSGQPTEEEIAEVIDEGVEESGETGDGEPESGETPAESPAGDNEKETHPTDGEELPTETSSGEEPAGQESADESEEGEPPIEGEVVPAESSDELTTLRTQVESLTKIINDLAGGDKPVAPISEETPTGEAVPVDATVEKLLETMDFDQVMDKKESFVKFFLDAMEVVKAETVQQTLLSIPQVVGSVVHRQASLRDVAMTFYTTHPELKPVKQYVGKVATQISAENPEWDIQQVFEETAKKVKDTLNILDVVQKTEKKEVTKPKPALPGVTSVRNPSKPSGGLQSEIDDLIND